VEGDSWVFVYKAAAEIGELGDNTKTMRQHILQDALLRRVVSAKNAQVSVIGHTRWASVGIISEPNAHPVTGEEINKKQPLVLAVLNGDVDNYADLKVEHDISVAASITTDAKVIPSLVARGLQSGQPLQQSFLNAVTQFDGSVAIAALSVDHPDSVMLGLRGSGQGMCIGLAEDRFIVASEPYGTVEDTVNIVRMDGESLVSPDQPASRGQVIQLLASDAGTVEGMQRVSYDGSALPVTGDDVVDAGVTTRDIDRGTSPHFLLKEILEAPESFRKTLRGRIHEKYSRFSRAYSWRGCGQRM
jgi:glucosamine--fructose-6-phosphate aminotransferase (isomerizing)